MHGIVSRALHGFGTDTLPRCLYKQSGTAASKGPGTQSCDTAVIASRFEF